MTDKRRPLSGQNMAGWSEIRSTLTAQNGTYSADIPPHWKQGRTAYGGLTAALMLATAHEEIEDLPPLRSALVNFVGPVKENPTLTANLERRGRNVTNVSAVARNGDQAVGRADFLFGAARSSTIHVDMDAPEAPAPEDCELFTPEAAQNAVPSFFHNFDTRLVAGARPMMGDEGYIRAWSRHLDPRARTRVEALLCLADVLPPAAMPLLRKFAPVSSMSWIVNFLTDSPETRDGWWHVESKLTAARGGYSSQVMRIWNTGGELIVEGLQSIAIFDG